MWSHFETSPLEDETISNVFSSRGMFRMRSEEKIENYPFVQACVQNKQMVVAIDKSFVLVEEDKETKCSFLSFNSKIDSFTVSRSGNLIICGLSNGEVHGVYIKGLPVFSISIQMGDISLNGKSFAAIEEVGRHFYFVCTNGSVYRLSEIDESATAKLSTEIYENETIACEETLLDNITVERLSNFPLSNEIESAVLIPQSVDFDLVGGDNNIEDCLLIAGSNRCVCLCSYDSHAVRLPVPESYGGVKRIYNLDNYILLLTFSGHLLELCPITRMIIFKSHSNDLLIDELIVMESNDENIEFLMLTKETNCASETRLMKFVQYPSLKCTNDFEVSKHSWIVQQPKCAVNLYYLRGEELNGSDLPTVVEMMTVSETHPSERFKKLIAKGHLQEAEDYGAQFELCLQPIYEAKAKHALIQLCNLDDNNPELMNQQFTELTEVMEMIENREFFHKNRLINLGSRKITKRFLKYLLKRLDMEHDESHFLEILEQLRRLETLSIIDPYECDCEWKKFVYSENLVKYLTSRLKSNIPIACLIWKRHSSSLIPFLNSEELEKMLSLIPNNSEPFHIIQWLRQYIPIISNTHPDTMPFVTDWSIQKTRALQHSEHWPAIGLEFSTKILQIMKEIEFMHFDVRRQYEQNIAKLQELVNALEELSILQKSYNLIFTLDNYQQESLDETTLCILQRASLVHVKGIVNDFLYPIYQEQAKNPVNAIRRYINFTVASRNNLSTWLERAVACIDLLHNEDDRFECALTVLQCAPVPWPETVGPLVKLRFSSHPLAIKISGEFEKQVIKMMKVKYGWPADSATDMNLELFMMRIVKMDLPDMLDDIRVLTKAAPEISTSASFTCCYQLVRRGKSEMAFKYFKSLNAKKEHSKSVDEIFEIFTDLLENVELYSDSKFMEEQRCLIEFLKLIAPKNCISAHQRVQNVVSRLTLFQRFKVLTNAATDLVSYQTRLKLLNAGVSHIISGRDSNQNLTKYFINEISELTAALRIHKIKGIRLVCQQLKCLPLTCSLAYAVLESDDSNSDCVEDLIDLALDLLAQQILADSSDQKLSSSSLNYDIDPLAFPLACELLVRANLYSKDHTLELVDLITYVNICNMSYPFNAIHNFYGAQADEVARIINTFLSETTVIANGDGDSSSISFNTSIQPRVKPEKKRVSVSVFDEVEVQPAKKILATETTVMKFVARTLLLLVLKVKPKNSIMLKLRNTLLSEDENLNVSNASKSFFSSLTQLVKMKIHGIWYTVALHMLDYQEQHDCTIIERDFVTVQLSRVFHSLMKQNDCNFMDLFAMLIANDHTELLLERLEQDLKTDQQRYNFLTLLQMYNEFMGDKKQTEIIRNKRLKQYYYMEFCKQDPTIKGKFNINFDDIDKLLKEFQKKQIDVCLLERISRDFDLNLDYMLLLQVLSILQSQEMQYEVTTNTFGDEELVMITTVEYIRSLCQPYINKMKSTEMLTTKLKQFIEGINHYFYEMYLCVIEILTFIDTVPKEMHIWTSILHFLKHKLVKRRRNRPGQLETDMWLQIQPDIGVLPKIAKFRIPFKPIVEKPLKDILDHELTVDNCESWFPLIDLHIMLKGSKDGNVMRSYFIMTAVKNCINEYKPKNDTEVWHIQPTNNAFLKSVLRLVKHIENPSKVFFTLYFVSTVAPEGADQVEATFECYKYALENEKHISDPKHQDQLLKIKRKYPIIKTQHLLYVYGLTDEKLLHLIENPKELIYNLYHHDLILKPSKLDINAVIKEIAQLHDIDLEEIESQLLQKWLSFTLNPADGTVTDETFFEEPNTTQQNMENTENAAENVLRANYILNSWPKKEAEQFLIGHAFPTDGAPNTFKQLQALECLSKLNDGSPFMKNMINQRKYITVKCVHDLKELGYNSSITKFEKCSKIDILKTIWQRNAQNPHTLEILANICLGYEIYVERIWNGILKRMVMFNMIRELNALVDVLSCHPQLLQIEGLVGAWDYVLKHPFQSANKIRSFEQEERLFKNLVRLQSCPVLEKLNLLEFAQLCTTSDRPHMAAVLMTLSKDESQRKEIKRLVLSTKSEKLRKDILDLEDAGILPMILNYTIRDLEL